MPNKYDPSTKRPLYKVNLSWKEWTMKGQMGGELNNIENKQTLVIRANHPQTTHKCDRKEDKIYF